jgi:hypothetical protein
VQAPQLPAPGGVLARPGSRTCPPRRVGGCLTTANGVDTGLSHTEVATYNARTLCASEVLIRSQVHALLALEQDTASDEVELSHVSDELRRELLALDVESVDRVEGAAPGRTKSSAAATLGALTVTLSPAVLTSMLDLIRSFLATRPVRSVTVTIDGDSVSLSRATAQEQHELLEAYLRRHGDQSDGEP